MGYNSKRRKQRKETEPATTQDGRVVVSRAKTRYVRCSPRKVALVANLIRGKNVGEALQTLQFTHRPSAVPYVERTLKSALANAENLAPEPKELVIAEIIVNGAPMLKRMRPASMGRAVRVRKRMTHLTIHLTEE